MVITLRTKDGFTKLVTISTSIYKCGVFRMPLINSIKPTYTYKELYGINSIDCSYIEFKRGYYNYWDEV